jgi:hypothetical protein
VVERDALATSSGQCIPRYLRNGAITCNHLQITAATDPTPSCYPGETLESYKAFGVNSINSLHVALIFIKFKEGRFC